MGDKDKQPQVRDAARTRITYARAREGDQEVLCDGVVIAAFKAGADSKVPGLTVRYGRGFQNSRWFADEASGKAWIERTAPGLLQGLLTAAADVHGQL
jgi:hypothetical protein